MMKKKLSVLFKIFISLTATIGVLIQVGLFGPKWDFSELAYFTVLSNLGCAIYFGFAAIHQYHGENNYLPTLKGVLHLCITITGIVYHLLLGGKFEMPGLLKLSNILLHTIVPISVNLNWLIFDEKKIYTWKMPFVWLLAPLIYTICINIMVYFGAILGPYQQPYPYYFMDPTQVGGVGHVILIDIMMGIGFLILGLALTAFDRKLGKKHYE